MSRSALFAVLLFLTACAGQSADAPPTSPDAPGPSASPEAPGPAAPGPVQLSPDGATFDPPVELSQIPNGAWMCDMGTSHYAAGEKGDGKCPVCKMDLVEQKNGPEMPKGAE